MTRRVDSAKSVDTYPRVSLCRFEFRVSEHLGDVADVGSSLEHERRHGVPEEMTATSLCNSGRRGGG